MVPRTPQERRLIRLTQKLLSFNTENPPGREEKCGHFIASLLRQWGYAVRTYSFAPRRPNVVAMLRGTAPRDRAARAALLLSPHYDTVPIGSPWKCDPYGRDIVRGRLYGRGASDDKGNTAVCLEVLRRLKEKKVRLKRDLVLAATVDEETGSHAGIIPLLEKGILQPQAALIVDSDEFDTIVAQKGLIHARVQIFGKKAHGAYHWRGRNAIEIAARVIQALKRKKFRYRRHPLLHGPTVNIGTIRGGDKVNMVADWCEFSLDVRFTPDWTAARMKKSLKAVIRTVTSDFRFIVDDEQAPYAIDPKHFLVQTYVRTARTCGIKATVKGSEGATVITFFQKKRIPAFATGFGAHGTAHTNDEYVHIRTLIRGAEVLEKFILNYDVTAPC